MVIWLWVSLSFMTGCTSFDKKDKRADHFKKWRMLSEESQPVTPVPEKTSDLREMAKDPVSTPPDKVEPTGSMVELEPVLPDMPVSMRMHNVSVPVLLRTLARSANVNIMINDSITGHANIDIQNIPWDQAFLGLLETYGLTYEWSGRILRIITVDDLNNRKALLEAEQEYEQIKNEHSIAMLKLKKQQQQYDPLLTKIIKIHYADLKALQLNLETYLATEMINSVNHIPGEDQELSVSPKMRGTILMDEVTNSLIVQASQNDIDKILPLIEKLDQPIRQVRIEAHIVEANSDIAKELGIQWGGLGLHTSGKKNTWIGGPIGTNGKSLFVSSDDATPEVPAGSPIIHLPSIGTGINFPSSENAGVQGWEGMTIGLMHQRIGDYLLYAQLTALEEEGELNILSKPSITTMDHRKAVIKSGKEVPFQTIDEEGNLEVEFKEAVIKLEVIPHIIDNEIVRLEILTHKDELDWTRTVNGNPTIITKNAETQVTLFDGQTTVIAGLNKEKLSSGESGVPGLKDVPGLGMLFKSKNKSNDMEELLIFITPRILESKTSSPASQKQ